MKCDKCKLNEASVYIEQDINGYKETAHLCMECASAYNMNTALSSVFQGFINSFKAFSPEPLKDMAAGDKACPACGMTYSQLRHSSKLGCERCYEAFSKELNSVFANIQPGCRHTGKIPGKSGKIHLQTRELENLRKSLNAAIQNEEYEEAARLRDMIKALCDR